MRYADQIVRFQEFLRATESETDDAPPVAPERAAEVLRDLLTRSDRAGADLRDPTPELVRWVLRDVSGEEAVSDEDYDAAVTVLAQWLLFLRRDLGWRRSERNVDLCWDLVQRYTTRPIPLGAVARIVDSTLATVLASSPAAAEVSRALLVLPVVRALELTCRTVVSREALSADHVVSLAQLPQDSATADVWLLALELSRLLETDDDGFLRAGDTVADAGRMPRVSDRLARNLVAGLVQAAVIHQPPDDAPREIGDAAWVLTTVALVTACDPTLLEAVPDDPDDEEESLLEPVTDLATALLGERGDLVEPTVVHVASALDALTWSGLLQPLTLPRGGETLAVPTALRHAVAQALGDLFGTGDDHETGVRTLAPVEIVSTLPAGTWLEIAVEEAGTVRVAADADLETVRREVTTVLGVDPVAAVLSGASDVPAYRFAHPSILDAFDDDGDEVVTDSTAAQVGGVLAVGDTFWLQYVAQDGDEQHRTVRLRVTGSGAPS
ncbi:hypothetical protein C8046_11150 [Serinibacter arcticus]|uniref:Uncharacterized protein n=1 Tax=Serinibacter arcticus TaxID=1655435 RepID=A0A2U1ZVW8_9MICO|nr:hypothetical protein [Serinibacter arcticus]PWD51119.1 hypothetical protein C8046_11150 [Serinibacter arcticus]